MTFFGYLPLVRTLVRIGFSKKKMGGRLILKTLWIHFNYHMLYTLKKWKILVEIEIYEYFSNLPPLDHTKYSAQWTSVLKTLKIELIGLRTVA